MKWQSSLKIWREDRGITQQPNSVYQEMMDSEKLEFRDAVIADDWHEQVDAVCDQLVLTENHINLIDQDDLVYLDQLLVTAINLVTELTDLGVVPDLAMKQTLKEISSREQSPEQAAKWKEQGGNITGEKWQKDPNQDPATLYKADYNLTKATHK